MPMSKRSRYAILSTIAVVSVVIAASSINFIYHSPKYSWNPAIRDSDGDGVPDSSDLRPHDPSIWGYGNAIVNLTIYNKSNGSSPADYVNFSAYWQVTNETWEYGTEIMGIQPGSAGHGSFNVSWLMGEDTYDLSVYVKTEEWRTGPMIPIVWFWQHGFIVHDGETLRLAITFTADFEFAE